MRRHVATRRIDDVVPADQPIAFVEIDVEGGEYHALLGATRVVRRWRPVIVFEPSERSTGQHGVTPDAMFDLVTDALGCDLTTMARWLDGAPPCDRDAFVHVWREGLEFFFHAAPRDGALLETRDG